MAEYHSKTVTGSMMRDFGSKLQTLFEYRVFLGVTAAFFLPLKLIVAYGLLIPALALWYLQLLFNRKDTSAVLKVTLLPLLIFLISASLAALFGIDPLRSLKRLGGLALLAGTIPLYYDIAKRVGVVRVLSILLAGQTVAALHSVTAATFPAAVPGLFLGQVTESGQLAMTLVVALGLVAFVSVRNGAEIDGLAERRPLLCFSHSPRGYLMSFLNFFIVCLAGFSPQLRIGPLMHSALILAALVLLGSVLLPALKKLRANPSDSAALLLLFLGVIIPLLAGALLVNLKRGPWAGVLIACLVLIYLYGRKYLFTVLAALVVFSFYLQPVYQRISGSADDFFISGGRAEIWEIGAELISRYPLGIGYKNSSFLRNFSPEIPPQLTHFHNNFLNIAVETGWLSLFIFLWWLYLLIRAALAKPYQRPESILKVAIGCALLSWQVAGVVEYNFGDAEVMLVAFLLMGLLSNLLEQAGAIQERALPANSTASCAL